MNNILDIGNSDLVNDDTIIKNQYYSYSPYLNSFNADDEIRIAIQSRDLYVVPSQSYIYIEIEASRKDIANAGTRADFCFNFISYFFSDVRYEINGVEVDRCKNVGITTTLKRLTAQRLSDKPTVFMLSSFSYINITNKTYGIILPLSFLLGFAEDYNKIILIAKHELILTRARKGTNTYIGANDCMKFIMKKVLWKIPQITLSDTSKLKMLRYLERKQSINVHFRSWELFEIPKLPESTKHVWNVKTTHQLNRPRYIIIGFQTDRNLNCDRDASYFDHCKISDVKVYLNSECYPYDNYNLDFDNGNNHELYYHFTKIHSSYYNGAESFNSIELNEKNFDNRFIFAFDCTRADESLLNSMVDVRVEINARENIPDNTAAYCLMIHDNSFQYSPFNGIVNKNI